MKYFISLYLFCCLFASCGGTSEVSNNSHSLIEAKPLKANFDPFNWDTLKGSYIGDFAGSDIQINITYVSNKNVVGYNIHKGLYRNISGKVNETKDSIVLHMDEPGDNKFDGSFQIVVLKSNLEMHGTWVPFKKGIGKVAFSLTKVDLKGDD